MTSLVWLQLPIIYHGNVKVPDSAFIINYLTATYPDKVHKLTPEQEGLSVVLAAYLDYKFMGNVWACRWVYDQVRIPPNCTTQAVVLFRKYGHALEHVRTWTARHSGEEGGSLVGGGGLDGVFIL